jgi:hypothetical protein
MFCGKKDNQITQKFKDELLVFLNNKRAELTNLDQINEISLVGELMDLIEERYPSYPDAPYVVDKITNLGTVCPSQWEGKTKCGKSIYARFRGGRFRLDINDDALYAIQLHDEPNLTLQEYLKTTDYDFFNKNLEAKINSWEKDQFYRKLNGGRHSYLGQMSNEEMIAATKGFLDFSEVKWNVD